MNLTSLILTLAIICGQLIKIPLSGNSGIAILDIVVMYLCLFGIFKLGFRLKKPPLFITGALIFIFTATLSLIFTPLKLTSMQFLTSFLYTIRFSAYILLGWEIYSGAYPQLKNKIIQVLITSGFCLAVLGLIQFIFLPNLSFLQKFGGDPHYYRTVSTFLDPNFVGAFFVLTLILLLNKYRQFTQKFNRQNLLYILVFIALLTTFSRSGYLMFLISFLGFSSLKKSMKMAIITLILFTVLLASFQIYIKAVNTVTPLDRNQTASLRLSTWQQGLEIFSKNPILGIGFNAYNVALRQYKLGDEQFLSGKGATTNDSSLLYILSTTGILGFIAYLIFILGIIKSKNFPLISATAGLLINSFFVNSLFYPFILIWIILIASQNNEKTIK